MEQTKIDRINELARKKKSEGLTDDEIREQAELRKEYLEAIRASVISSLDNTVIQYPDGSQKKLSKND